MDHEIREEKETSAGSVCTLSFENEMSLQKLPRIVENESIDIPQIGAEIARLRGEKYTKNRGIRGDTGPRGPAGPTGPQGVNANGGTAYSAISMSVRGIAPTHTLVGGLATVSDEDFFI